MRCAPRRRQSIPRPAARGYGDVSAAAFLTGLGAGEWSDLVAQCAVSHTLSFRRGSFGLLLLERYEGQPLTY